MMPEISATYKTSPGDRKAAREILLLGIKNEINPEDRARLAALISGTVDFEYLIFLADYQGITPLLAYNLGQAELKSLLPEIYQERLNRSFQNNVYRNMFLSEELGKLLSVFNQNGIKTITIKGVVLSEQLYVNPLLRITTDMDILIDREKIAPAVSLLVEMGYQELIEKRKRKHTFHRVYYKDTAFPLVIELHWDLKDPSIVAFPISDIWSRSREYRFHENNTRVLSPEDNFLYLAYNPLMQDGQLLKYLCDITRLLRIHRNDLNWDFILDSANSLGISSIIYYSQKWSRELLDAPVPVSVMEELRPALWKRWLISFFMSDGDIFLPIKSNKLRNEILALTRSVMLNRVNKSLLVLAKYRGYNKKFVWLRTITSIPIIFTAAMCLNIGKIFRRL
jgi:hypothetical protein